VFLLPRPVREIQLKPGRSEEVDGIVIPAAPRHKDEHSRQEGDGENLITEAIIVVETNEKENGDENEPHVNQYQDDDQAELTIGAPSEPGQSGQEDNGGNVVIEATTAVIGQRGQDEVFTLAAAQEPPFILISHSRQGKTYIIRGRSLFGPNINIHLAMKLVLVPRI
jgi:hypothetical protein